MNYSFKFKEIRVIRVDFDACAGSKPRVIAFSVTFFSVNVADDMVASYETDSTDLASRYHPLTLNNDIGRTSHAMGRCACQ